MRSKTGRSFYQLVYRMNAIFRIRGDRKSSASATSNLRSTSGRCWCGAKRRAIVAVGRILVESSYTGNGKKVGGADVCMTKFITYLKTSRYLAQMALDVPGCTSEIWGYLGLPS